MKGRKGGREIEKKRRCERSFEDDRDDEDEEEDKLEMKEGARQNRLNP